jgi:hypothetical protein
MSHKVFISYSSNDLPVATAVCEELEKRGVTCWIAPRDITPGASWANSLSLAIKECVVFVLILSTRSSESQQVLRELSIAQENNKIVVPFLIEDFEFTGFLKYSLFSVHVFDATKQSLKEAVIKLIKNVIFTLQQNEDLLKTDEISHSISPAEFNAKENNPPKNVDNAAKYDVFISYRRSSGSQTARVIRSEIQNRGYKVFLDVDDLRPGHFDESLINCIRNTTNFVIILSKGSLERCSNVDDWLRKEILTAINNKKNIIPLLMPGFSLPKPEEIPQELRPLLVHHGINYSHEYFNAMVDKLVSFLA